MSRSLLSAPPTHLGRSSLRGPLPLRDDTLDRIPARVRVPGYDRAALRPGVVHLGVGSFHRSHQAVYFDDIAASGRRDWGLVGVGLRRPQMRDALSVQQGLYTVVERGAGNDRARVVGAMTRYLFAPREPEAVLAALAAEGTAVVTLTVTADAYDLASPEPRSPSGAVGHLVEALDRRRRAGVPPFTVVSCDNLAGNGDAAREAILAIAERRDPRLARWIAERAEFPCSMVDRITPQTGAGDRKRLARDFGISDRWPVITEPFSQWVLEDRFCNARPPLDEVGVRMVSDVAPYALMKTRLLNATHCAIGHLGSLAGLRRADEVMRDPIFNAYVRRFMQREVVPLLDPVPGVDLQGYVRTLLDRLANPAIADRLERLCRSGSSKLPEHVVPSIREARRRGTEHELLTLAVAGWLCHLRGTDERGQPAAVEDPLADRLQPLALAAGTDPRPLLSDRAIFGELAHDPAFARSLEDALVALERDGVRGAIAARLTDNRSVVA
jgi:fructuronate reductase/mannitol 2-dehydrogenase